MAYIEEKQDSRVMNWNSESASTSRMYHLVDYPDTQDALEALSNYIPSDVVVGNYLCVLPEYSVSPVFSDPDRTLYEATVTWKTPDIASGGGGDSTATDPKEPEDLTSLSFNFSSISRVIQNSVPQTDSSGSLVAVGSTQFFPAGGFDDVLSDTINQQHPELPPEGVEVNSPIITITAKTVVSRNVATTSWWDARFDQIWTTNASTWNGLSARCVMLTGIQANERGDGHWDVTHNFEYRPRNPASKFSYWKQGSSTPDTMDIPAHAGWVHVDVNYNQLVNTDQNGDTKTFRTVTGVTLHNVYPQSDFDLLGLNGV
jgi:hypothetical protein